MSIEHGRTNINDIIQDKEIIVDIKEEQKDNKKIYEYIQKLIHCNGCHSCNGFSISVCLTVSIIWIIVLMLGYY